VKTLTWEKSMPTTAQCEVELRHAQLPVNANEWTPLDMPCVEAALELARMKHVRRLLRRGYELPDA
jgi:hypothetical protein